MFKKTRRKIVAAIMFILVCLFAGTLAVIYTSSYFEVSNSNYEMLKRHAQMYILPSHVNGGRFDDFALGGMEPFHGNEPGGKHFENTPSFRLSTFYSVAIAENGQVLAIDRGDREVYDAATLERYAKDILESQKNKGKKRSLVYLVEPKDGYTLIAFMDNTVMHESMTTLFHYTLVFGSVALAALFFLAVYLAKRIVDPLEKSYSKQKQFISDAGHELKTPISVVSANAELLSRETGDNQWLSNIQYENERMGILVAQLLELARTENVTPQMEHIDFSRLVAGEALPFESVAFESGLTLSSSITGNIRVVGNSAQLKQVVSILLDNAIRYSKESGSIYLNVTKAHGFAVLAVINKGDEIPKQQRQLIFERFYRADTVRNSEDHHYGLGLAIAKAITASHKGHIDVLCHNGLVEFRVQIPAL